MAPLEQTNDKLEQFYAVSEPQNGSESCETRPAINIQTNGTVRFSNTKQYKPEPMQQQLANLHRIPWLLSNIVAELSNGTKREMLPTPKFRSVTEEKSAIAPVTQ